MSRIHHQEAAYLWTRRAAKHARAEDLHALELSVAHAHLAAAKCQAKPQLPK